jgi:hypothetical protein
LIDDVTTEGMARHFLPRHKMKFARRQHAGSYPKQTCSKLDRTGHPLIRNALRTAATAFGYPRER